LSDLGGDGGGGGGEENVDGAEDDNADSAKGALFFTYYIHRNAKFGWFLENLKETKIGTAD